jgi:poly(A) polymerase
MRDNRYGKLEEDVVRRDFKINALYYDVHKQETSFNIT